MTNGGAISVPRIKELLPRVQDFCAPNGISTHFQANLYMIPPKAYHAHSAPVLCEFQS